MKCGLVFSEIHDPIQLGDSYSKIEISLVEAKVLRIKVSKHKVICYLVDASLEQSFNKIGVFTDTFFVVVVHS